MANPQRRHPANVEGPWFVDNTCIDCDVARQVAPSILGKVAGQSVVIRQPETEEEVLAAERALLACPVAAIGVVGHKVDPEHRFPQEIEDGVDYCGFNSSKSYGANAFFVRRPTGNFLVDAPRFVPQLVRRFEELGGIQHVLLTHQDDVADADRYAAHFTARVWIHEADRQAAPFATDILQGTEAAEVAPRLLAIPVPGHTRGSVVYLLESRFLFTGDSLYWSPSRQDLGAFRYLCWYSWEAQATSLERLAAYPFEWVVPGHGHRHRASPDEMRRRLIALVERMRGNTNRSG